MCYVVTAKFGFLCQFTKVTRVNPWIASNRKVLTPYGIRGMRTSTSQFVTARTHMTDVPIDKFLPSSSGEFFEVFESSKPR